MSLSKKLSEIDEKTKYAVYGWIRKTDRKISDQMPIIISDICAVYYYRHGDVFWIVGKGVGRTKDKKYIKVIQELFKNGDGITTFRLCNAFGLMGVDSMSNNIYQWDLQIRINSKCQIGIVSNGSGQPESRKRNGNYIIFGFWGSWTGYPSCIFEDGGLVTIKLDFKTHKISFSLNGYHKYSSSLLRKGDGVKYRLAVSMFDRNDWVKIKDFKQVKGY